MKNPQKIVDENIRLVRNIIQPYSVIRLAKIDCMHTRRHQLDLIDSIQDFFSFNIQS
jgi:hypothetical protein